MRIEQSTTAGSNVVPTNEDGPVSRCNAMSPNPPRNQSSRGTLQPTFGPVDDIVRQVLAGNFLDDALRRSAAYLTLLGSEVSSTGR